MVTLIELTRLRELAVHAAKQTANFLACVAECYDPRFAPRFIYLVHQDLYKKSDELEQLLRWHERDLLQACAITLQPVMVNGHHYSTAHKAAAEVLSKAVRPLNLPEHMLSTDFLIGACVRENLDRYKKIVFDEADASYLVARIDQEFALACKLVELPEPKTDATEVPLVEASESAPDAHPAYFQQLFPDGPLDKKETQDCIEHLFLHRGNGKNDIELLQEFTGKSKSYCKGIQGRIRKARDAEQTTLPPAK